VGVRSHRIHHVLLTVGAGIRRCGSFRILPLTCTPRRKRTRRRRRGRRRVLLALKLHCPIAMTAKTQPACSGEVFFEGELPARPFIPMLSLVSPRRRALSGTLLLTAARPGQVALQ